MTSQDNTDFFDLDPLKFTKAPLRAEQTVSLNAPPDKVWALISDHEKTPTYLPMIARVTVDNSRASIMNGVGAVRACTMGDMTLEEEIKFWKPSRAMAYGLSDSNTVGMKGHLGVVLLASNRTGGTDVRWKFYFDHPEVEMMTTQARGALEQGMAGLVEIFGGTQAASALPEAV
jgi:carbon monoxide dehydrogenase subunit G